MQTVSVVRVDVCRIPGRFECRGVLAVDSVRVVDMCGGMGRGAETSGDPRLEYCPAYRGLAVSFRLQSSSDSAATITTADRCGNNNHRTAKEQERCFAVLPGVGR